MVNPCWAWNLMFFYSPDTKTITSSLVEIIALPSMRENSWMFYSPWSCGWMFYLEDRHDKRPMIRRIRVWCVVGQKVHWPPNIMLRCMCNIVCGVNWGSVWWASTKVKTHTRTSFVSQSRSIISLWCLQSLFLLCCWCLLFGLFESIDYRFSSTNPAAIYYDAWCSVN